MSTVLLDAQQTESSVIASVMAEFELTKEQLHQAVKDSSLIVVDGPDDKKGMAVARETRLAFQKTRTTIEKRHKKVKAKALAYCRTVDSVKNDLIGIIQPEEQRLKELEETAAREAERIAELEKQAREVENKRRCDVLAKINVMVPVIELQFMDAPTFNAFYLEKRTAFDAAEKVKAEEEAARKAEAERLAKQAEEQAARQAEIDRQQAELAKKQAEQQAELDRQRAEIEAQQKAIDDAEKAKREKCLGWRTSQLAFVNASMPVVEMMAMSDEEFEQHVVVMRHDNERRIEEAAKAEVFRKEQEAKAEAERIAIAAKEEADRIERERLAEIARKEAEAKAAKEEAARIAALAPDREKIDAYICSVNDIAVPTLSTTESQDKLAYLVGEFIDDLREMIAELEKGTL